MLGEGDNVPPHGAWVNGATTKGTHLNFGGADVFVLPTPVSKKDRDPSIAALRKTITDKS